MGLKREDEDEVKEATLYEMMRYASPFDWTMLVVGTVCAIISGFTVTSFCLIYRQMIGMLIEAEDQYQKEGIDMQQFRSKMIQNVSLCFAQSAVSFVSHYTGSICFLTICDRQIDRIRKQLFHRILNQDIPWLEKNQVGKLTQKMSAGIERIRDGMSNKVQFMIEGCSALFFGVIFSFILR
ncbi:ABC transmembrane type-1 domain-containing protein [Aphelenchoides besseyi]|nr:ABC transmembrane type-1 domain-containing protein [Aphelenchoides besseyi]KAI6231449.1 ABC transmembrane type-1 domain-containing protein [Aphelenchoides besseyi]